LEMARENAREEAAKSRLGGETAIALERLGCILGLKSPPRRIEGFDIAHLGGADTVASMVSFRDGKPEKRLYRSFTIRSLKGSKIDDYEAIREAVARRYTRVLNEGLEKPDLILIDGGKGQLSAAKGILDGLGLEGVPIAGLAKKREEIFLPGSDAPILLEEGTPSLRILQAVRNESHRFATTLHKRKRAKHIGLELLERVPGIGRKRSRRLMEAFGSLEAILGESPKEVSRKSGIPMAAVEELLRLLSEALPMAGLEPDM
jgi:excinuclease ABC subunit C